MLFCLGWAFNFLIGGLSGVFLSDAPSDTDTHGSFFVMAHFHYTIMGGLIFTFFAAIYYWVPKMVGLRFNERLAKALLADVHRLQLDLHAAVRARHGGHAPTRVEHLRAEPARAQHVGVDLGLRARPLDAGLPRQRRLLADLRARAGRANPWRSKSLEWQMATPVPVNNFEQIPVIDSDPYDYGTPLSRRRAAQPAAAGS